MKFPYGIADFTSIRREAQVYVDRTDRIPILEDLGKTLLFLRPRRFGKSLWLDTLATYYDVRTAEEHESLFGGLAAGESPTPLAHRYFVLRWDFSKIDPDPPPRGRNAGVSSRAERIGNEIHDYLNTTLETFLTDYREHLPAEVHLEDNAFFNLERLLAVLRQTPYRLYLLIDEYDNFANEVMTWDAEGNQDLVQADGPFKYLFKWIKAASGRTGIERFFIAGVSPVAMSDITSGMNIAENIYLYPELNSLCGFTEEEVHDLLAKLHAAMAAKAPPEWRVENALTALRDWYNGYRFALGASETLYNPTLVLYFLKHLQRTKTYPGQMLDANLAVDEKKLDYVARVASGQEAVLELVRRGGSLEVLQLRDRFTLRDMLELSTQDTSFLGAFLFYFGMLTLGKERTPIGNLELFVPNEVMRGLYLERLRQILLPSSIARSNADKILFDFLADGEIEPLLDFIETALFPTFSNRDATWANELTLKTIFLTLLWNQASYLAHSEPEVEHRYVDLCFLRRPERRDSSLRDLLFEFKRLSLKEIGLRGQDLKSAEREALVELGPVKSALAEAREQLASYRAALERRHGEALELRSYAVVALGFERLIAERG